MQGPLHRGPEVERVVTDRADAAAAEAFCRHFFKCFFCHIGDRYTEDHFCEKGRELIVKMLDGVWES